MSILTLAKDTVVALAFVEAVRAWREGHRQEAVALAFGATYLTRAQRRNAAVEQLNYPDFNDQIRSHVGPHLGQIYDESFNDATVPTDQSWPTYVTPDAAGYVSDRTDLLVALSRDASDAVARAVDHLDPWTAAGLLVDTAGLNRQQANGVVTYHRSLITPLAQPEGQPAVPPMADDLVTRSIEKRVQLKMRERGSAVGSNEWSCAVQTARLDAWRYYGDHSGFTAMWIEGMTPMQEWVAREGACDECAGMDGKRVGIYEEFPVPLPAHPSCRCDRVLVEVPAGEPTVR